jgi:hypothetical protein
MEVLTNLRTASSKKSSLPKRLSTLIWRPSFANSIAWDADLQLFPVSYDKLAANYLAFIRLASIKRWLHVHALV